MPSSPTLPPKHAVYGITANLIVNGKTIPITDLVIEFVLDQIPIARVQVPSGVTLNNAAAGQANGSGLLEPADLMGKKPAKIYLTGKGKPHPANSKATPSGDFSDVIFDGYVLTSSVDFSTTGTTTTVVIIHWMYDLDSASFACGDFDKNAPANWFSLESNKIVNPNNNSPLFDSGGEPVLDNKVLTEDWWEGLIRPAAKYKSSQPLMHFNGSPPPNTRVAAAAMDKLVSNGTLKLNGTASAALASAPEAQRDINAFLGSVIMGSGGGTTAFEKFSTILKAFGCVLAPRIDTCEVIPYGVMRPADVEITDEECDFGSGSPNSALVPSAAVMYGGSGADIELAQFDSSKVETSFMGSYTPKIAGILTGPIVVFATPEYLSGIYRTPSPLGAQNFRAQIFPASSVASAPAATPAPPGNVLGFANEVAKFQYFSHIYANKGQDVLCGFRLDISPGMVLSIKKNPSSSSGSNVSGLAKNWTKRGVVESVSLIFSTSNPKVVTNIRLRHVMEKQDMDLFAAELGASGSPLFDGPKKLLPLR